MQLLLDIGNSSVNWALQENDKFISSEHYIYDKDFFEKNLQENLSFSKKPSDVLISNVAGNEIFTLISDWVKKQWQIKCWQPDVSLTYKELKNGYNDIAQMGIDRWLAMVASWEMYQTALCLVDCGTALTIDLIDIEGKHLGGYILPGIELMQKALTNNTIQINTDINNLGSINYANDTQTAVNNGVFLSVVSMIDRVVNTFSKEPNREVKCIISGGMAESVKPLLNHFFEYEPNLVLKGLFTLHKVRS